MTDLRQKLAEGGPAFGIFQSLPSPVVSDILGKQGVDFIVADIQHGALTWDSLLTVLYGVEAGGAAPLVRIGWNDPAQVMRALDLGAQGVIVPMVSTAADAAIAAQAMRYGPAGNRSIGPVRQPPSSKIYDSNDNSSPPLHLPMIETAEGLANIEEIATTPGVDGLFFGPGDLSLSLGLGLSLDHPDVIAAGDTVVATCERHGLIAGTVGFGEAGIGRLMRRGFRLVSIGSDRHYIGEGVRQDLGHAESWRDHYRQGSAERRG